MPPTPTITPASTTPTLGMSGDSVKAFQTQLNTQNAGIAGYTPLTVDGKYGPLTQAASQFKPPQQPPVPDKTTDTSTSGTQTPPTGTTGASTTTPTLSDPTDRTALAQAQTDFQTQAKNVSDTITNIQNGTIPLSAGEQAQVDGLKQQFQTLIDQQGLANTSASGIANVRGYQTGAAEYDPMFQAKTIGSIVTGGLNKIADLNIKMGSAVATLTQSFKDNDIKGVQAAWDAYKEASKSRTDALQKTIDDTTAAIKDANDRADKDRQYNLDVTKFNKDIADTNFTQQLDTKKFEETVKSDAFDRAYKMEDLALKKQANTIASQTNLPAVPLSTSGKPDKASQQSFLESLPGGATGAMATGVKGLTTYTIIPTTFSSRIPAGQTESQRQQFVTMAKQYDPTYDENLAPARAAYLKSLASTGPSSTGAAINSANKAVNHLTAFVNSMNNTGNTASSKVNAVLNNTVGTLIPGTRTNLGAAKTEALGVAEELAKFFKGSGTTDVASIEAWKSQFSTNASPADVKGLTQGAVTLLAGQLETLAEQYTRTMGKPPDSDFIGPSAMASLSSLKDRGYKVDIPGVLYTDPKMYVKKDPAGAANLKQVIDAYPNLSQADALQLAQSLNQ